MRNNPVKYTKNSKEIINLAQKCIENSSIDSSLYSKYEVKRNLRDISGKGVLIGLTEISKIILHINKTY